MCVQQQITNEYCINTVYCIYIQHIQLFALKQDGQDIMNRTKYTCNVQKREYITKANICSWREASP